VEVYFALQTALVSVAINSINFLTNLVETPCQCCLEVQENFVWGKDLSESPFMPSTNPVFQLQLKMDENGPFFSTNPDLFEVRKRDFASLKSTYFPHQPIVLNHQ